jgi:hypothetical protein
MSETIDHYKHSIGRGFQALAAWWEAGAQARREHAEAVWGDSGIRSDGVSGADRMYRLMGNAWGSRR